MSGDLAGRVSLIVWHDPKTDPPARDLDRSVLALMEYVDEAQRIGVEPSSSLLKYMWVAWAELPTPSEATWRDLKHTVDIAEGAWGGTDPEVTRIVALLRDGE